MNMISFKGEFMLILAAAVIPIPALYGRYIFGDLSRNFFGNNGRLFTLNKKNIVGPTMVKKSKISELRIKGQDDVGLSLLGFGQDANGELYVLGNMTGVPFGDTGAVIRITPASGPKRERNFRIHLSTLYSYYVQTTHSSL